VPQLFLQEVAEQPVIHQAAGHLRQKQAAILRLRQPVRAVRQLEDGRAQLRRHAEQRRGRQQKVAQAGWLGFEHRAGERVEQRLRPFAAAQHDLFQVGGQGVQRQDGARWPAFQAGGQLLDLGDRWRRAQGALRQIIYFLVGEAKLFLAERQHLAARDHLGERQVGQDAADQDDMAVGRQQRDERLQPDLGGGRSRQHMRIVQEVQHLLVGVLAQVVGDQRRQLAGRITGDRSQVLDAGRHVFERGQHLVV